MLAKAMIARADRARDALRSMDDLDAVASDLVARARSAWPRIALDPEVFVGHVASRVDDAPDVREALAELHAEDLWLALACGLGDRRAIGELDKQFTSVVEDAVARLRGKVHAEDVAQVLREKLLVSRRGRPKILDYSGRGPLGGWIRIAAIRTALSATRHGDAAGMHAVTREELLSVPAAIDDPELAHFRSRYGKEFKAAFEAALAELTAEDRNLLRLSLVDGLSIDEIGSIFGAHRATAARRLARCREHVRERTRKILVERLKVGTSELRSILAYVRSHLDLSIQRLLADEAPVVDVDVDAARTTSPAKKVRAKRKTPRPRALSGRTASRPRSR